MGGAKKPNAFVDYAIAQAEERKRRASTVPIEDKGRIVAAGAAARNRKKKGRASTLLSNAQDDTLGVK